MVVLFYARLGIRQLFESGVHWRGPPFIRTRTCLEHPKFITDYTFLLMVSC